MKIIIIYVALATFIFVSGIAMLLKFKKALARGIAYLIMVIGLYSLISVFKVIDFSLGYLATIITFVVVFVIGGGISLWILKEEQNSKNR